jgi:flagellar hook-associated protein 3 FlgL
MLITANAFTNSLVNQLGQLTSRQATLQSEVSSGLSVTAPSDNPEAMESTLDYQAQNAAQTQYGNNITTLQARATTVSTVLQSMQSLVSQASEISTEAGGPNISSSEMSNYATQVNALINQAVQLVNTKDPATGQYLFGGTASSQSPFSTTTDANGDVSGVTYNGNSSVNQSPIGDGVTVSADIPGVNNSSTGARGLVTDSQSGADLFNHLIALRNDLQSGDSTAVNGADATNLQKDENNVLYQVSNNGAVLTRLTAAATAASSATTNLNTMISNSSSADMVETMVQLSQTQTAYQAALESGSKIMQLSILNYIG